MIKRYWFYFSVTQKAALPIGMSQGCGISAHNYEDAVQLLKEKAFNNNDIPVIENVVEDIDVSTLDANHVLPNIGNVSMRGIWFPLGY